jgi:prophage maintenance system killer protein
MASRTPSWPPPSSAQSKSTPTHSASSQTDGIRYLTVQDLVDLHRAVSAEFGGNQAQPGVIESQFGLLNAVQRPQVTTLGREAYPSFPDKVAAFVFALLSYRPFRGGNRRLAFASMFAFCELNNKTIDSRVLDEKTAENLFKRAANHRDLGIPPENVFREFKDIMTRAIVNSPASS